MKTYFVSGRKWWDKINGNAYFNAKVMDNNGNTLFYTGFRYGYGSQYVYEAEKMLKERLRKNASYKLVDLGAPYGLKKEAKNESF